MTAYNSLIYSHSPALWRRLKELDLSAQDRDAITRAFWLATQNGALEEGFERPAGASYNPRPARVACLVFDALKQPNYSSLVVSLLSTSKLNSPAFTDNFFSPIELAEALAVNRYTRGASQQLPSSLTEQVIAVCCLLDEMRHLHLTADCSAIPRPVESLLTSAPEQLQRERVFQLLTFAVERSQRHHYAG